VIFIMHMRPLGKMWTWHLGFCKTNLLLWEDRLDFGITRYFGISWTLVLSCVTWHRRWVWQKIWLHLLWIYGTSRACAKEGRWDGTFVFIHTMTFETMMSMMISKMILSRSGGDRIANKTQKKKKLEICMPNFT
jgi:hypothetical protein